MRVNVRESGKSVNKNESNGRESENQIENVLKHHFKSDSDREEKGAVQ